MKIEEPPLLCQLDANGKVTYIDWNEVERLAERHVYLTTGVNFNTSFNPVQMGMIAILMIAIREYILSMEKPDVQSKPIDNKHGPEVPPSV